MLTDREQTMTGRHALGGGGTEPETHYEGNITGVGQWHPAASGLGAKQDRETSVCQAEEHTSKSRGHCEVLAFCKLLVLLPTLSDKLSPEPVPPCTSSTLLLSDWVQPEAVLTEATLLPPGD